MLFRKRVFRFAGYVEKGGLDAALLAIHAEKKRLEAERKKKHKDEAMDTSA